ncbi:hypothetical protein [Tropicimonas sp.]|uniref:hypothetical protein n=1 Tax=Tropicimonas sp. TaxID=2067044 RepID=UPI003A84E180
MAERWHILRDGARLTLARHLPARFDVEARTTLPAARRLRIASQIRQDLWRAIRSQRGFSPVVEVVRAGGGLTVRAGGRITGAQFNRERIEARIAALLDDPSHRDRWLRSS